MVVSCLEDKVLKEGTPLIAMATKVPSAREVATYSLLVTMLAAGSGLFYLGIVLSGSPYHYAKFDRQMG